MTLLQQFRLWARLAPMGERLSALVGSAMVLALVTWLLVPSSSANSFAGGNQAGYKSGDAVAQTTSTTALSSTSTTSMGSSTNGASSLQSSGALSPSSGVPSQRSGVAPQNSGANSHGGCVAPPGTDQGVSATQIKVAMIIGDVAGIGNSAIGIPTAAEQEQYFQWVVNSVNASGGVACRQLVPVFVSANPADSSSLQTACLNAEQAGVFAVLDEGSYSQDPAIANCFPQNQIPYFTALMVSQAEQSQGYPYVISLTSLLEVLYHNTVFALNQMGEFSPNNGFRKLGIIYRDCNPQEISSVQG